MTTTYDPGTHTECYRDVCNVPPDVLVSVGSFVSRGWGTRYLMGFVGATHWDRRPDETTYVFQVRASDGSRFAVAASDYGPPFELTGRTWLAFLRRHEVEATVRGCQ